MRINHYAIGYTQEEKQKIFYELLENTMKMKGDKTIISDIEKFLQENIIKI